MSVKTIHTLEDSHAEQKKNQSKFQSQGGKLENKSKKLEGKKMGRWELEQKIKYYFFLASNQKLFERKNMRKNDKVFKVMSKYVGTRTPDQCRSHHQKIESKWPNNTEILEKLSVEFGRVNVFQIMQNYDGLSISGTIKSVESQNKNILLPANNLQTLPNPSPELCPNISIDHNLLAIPRIDQSYQCVEMMNILDGMFYWQNDDILHFM